MDVEVIKKIWNFVISVVIPVSGLIGTWLGVAIGAWAWLQARKAGKQQAEQIKKATDELKAVTQNVLGVLAEAVRDAMRYLTTKGGAPEGIEAAGQAEARAAAQPAGVAALAKKEPAMRKAPPVGSAVVAGPIASASQEESGKQSDALLSALKRRIEALKFGSIVRRIDLLESTHKFVAMKWLNDKVLKDKPEEQALLTKAREAGLLKTYEIENPWPKGRGPNGKPYMVKCCKLDRSNEVVKIILNDQRKGA